MPIVAGEGAMKIFMRKIVIPGLILLCVAGVAGAGAATHLSSQDAVLNTIERGAVPTGILYDLVTPLSSIDAFDGSAASPPIDASHWRQIYYEIYRASLDDPTWPEVGHVRELTDLRAAQGVIPIAVMDFAYNRIAPRVLSEDPTMLRADGLPAVEVDQILEKRAFAAAALRPYTYRGASVEFLLTPDFYFANRQERPISFRIDFGDGLGLRTVEMGKPCRISYAAPGRKTVRVIAELSGGSNLQASFGFDVRALETPSPDDTLFVTASIPHLGEYATGEAYIYYGESHTSLENPVLVIEGFDIDNTMNWEYLYNSMNQAGMVESLHTRGYDAVVLNFTEAVDYIQRNSFLVVELIQQVNSLVPPGADLAIVGASMGGLCARYALTYMEEEGLDHNTRTFISFDSPHKGANIPLGIQYWMLFFSPDSEDAAFLLERLGTPASRQMLVYFYTDPPGASGESDPLFGEFYADLDSLGGYPANLRRVAVANGSGHMIDQGFAPGEQIVLYEYSSLLVDIVGNVWAVPDNSYHIIFDGLMDLIWPLPDRDLVVYIDGTKPYDSAPGGTRASMAQMDSTEAPYGDIIALYDSHCFIPTISALDLDTDDLLYDIAGDPDILAHSPFDTVYYPVANEEHITITSESREWFLDEIQRGTAAGTRGPDMPVLGITLGEGRPNPFHGETTLRFYVPTARQVEIAIYDTRGRSVAGLLDETVAPGWREATWDGKDEAGKPVSSGIYFCRMATNRASTSQALVLVR